MNLVKWLRKNNMKVMAVVIIVLMVGFIGGSSLQQLFLRRRTGLHKPMAYFGENKKITPYDRALAVRELEILKTLGVNVLLHPQDLRVNPAQDLRAILLGELLFFDRSISPESIGRIKQLIRINGYRISDKQINDIYRATVPPDIYWLLLRNEAEQAGVRISNENAGRQLALIIPRLFPGATYSQLIGSIVGRQGIPERDILTTFGKLLAVLQYGRMMCSSEAVTTRQIMHNVSRENETIDVEFVEFDSAVFAETQGQPTEQEISEHFDRYKKFLAGAVSEENAYGFGYKLADRAGLEYIALKLDDVATIVTAPTQEELEEYYQKHREFFTEQVPSDPNDPNSLLTERIRSYAEVVNVIAESLLQNKINLRAEKILQEAKTLVEAGFEDIDTEPQNLSAEQLRQIAGDYETTAEQLSKKYKIKVYAGQTGLLSATDIQGDEYLGRLYLEGYGYNALYNPVVLRLPQIAFAVDELGVSELGPFDMAKPKMYENIGPMKDMFGQIMAVLRVTKTEKASEPENINQTFSKKGIVFEQDEKQKGEDIYSVKEKVVEDLKKLAAMDTAKSKAEEFVKQVAKDGWDSAVEKFNELYGQPDTEDGNDPNALQTAAATKGILEPFRLQSPSGLRRISKGILQTLAVQSEGRPGGQLLNNLRERERQFINHLYSLVPQDANTLDTVPFVLEFKPDMSYYVIKSISVKRFGQEEYEKVKAKQVYKEDFIQSQSLAAVHFNPENILKRMNFRPVREEEVSDANTPAETEAAL